MANMRGRPFAYLALTLSVWVGVRVIISADGDSRAAPLPVAEAVPLPVLRETSAVSRIAAPANSAQKFDAMPPSLRHRNRSISTNNGLPPAQDPWQDGGRPPGFSLAALVADKDEPQSAGRDTPPSKSLALMGEAGPPEKRTPPNDVARLGWGGELYAYSFWRFSTGSGSALAPGAQYGRSQSGIIGTIDPFGAPDSGLSLVARGSMTPDGDEREVALGLRWRPGRDWPLTLSAERRFRDNAPDRFAAYLAGGIDALPITGLWSLNAFGQAGYATGQGGGHFFDAQARAMHPLANIMGVPLSAGAGGWAGGQKGALRMDIGPTIAAKVNAGPTSLLIQLDWRLLAAGHAEPNNGLALTVSTGF
jgi:hypothetical protein